MNLNERIRNLIPQNGSLNYKNIILVIGGLIFLISLPFIFSNEDSIEKKEKKEKIENNLGTSQAHKELTEASKNNIILNKEDELDRDSEKQEEFVPSDYYEAREPIIDDIEKKKLERENLRRQTQLNSNTSNIFSMGQKQEMNNNIKPNYNIPIMPEEDNNLQKKKSEFVKNSSVDNFVLLNPLLGAISPYEIKAGTVIPLTLETGINSDIPGVVTAFIKEDIYDSRTGRILLIPGGSRVFGRYNSNVSFGQERVQLVFNRITLLNQKSINIGSMFGVDRMGQSGVMDKVDNKYGKVVGSVIISAVLGAGSAITTDNNDNSNDWKSGAGSGAGEQILAVGTKLTEKILNIQPTLTIRPGFTVGLIVEKDLILEPYEK